MWTVSGMRTRLLLQFIPASTLRHSLMDTASKNASPTSRILVPRTTLPKEGLPPLPDIKDDGIKTQVFTHRSFYARQTRLFEDHPDDPSSDNEMLEHLGDSVLGLIVTDLLRDTYPYLRVGPSAKIRSRIVGNSNLALISRRYRLPDRLRMHPAQVITLKASFNVQADVFESYVGGLYLDQGLEAVRSWLGPLLLPDLRKSYCVVREEYGLPPSDGDDPARKATPLAQLNTNTPIDAPRSTWALPPPARYTATSVGHLALFNQCLQQDSKSVEWVYSDSAGEGTKTTPVWVVRAIVDGKCVGRGRGSTKKAAKNEAAKQGLDGLEVHVAA